MMAAPLEDSMFAALRILITDPRWFARVYRFYRDGRWSGDEAQPPTPDERRCRALKKIFCDNG
jgi:hypothetical protein